MFALEVSFSDGVSESETIFVRRPQALIGAADYAHVVIDDMKAIGFQIRLSREAGRNFKIRLVGGDKQNLPAGVEGNYGGEADFNLGPVRFHVSALDSDLSLKEAEPPDAAGVRILRRAISRKSPEFPAIVVGGNSAMVLSFAPDQPVLIGRSKQCALRFDATEISAKHARLGYENGEFWIEDLGSTNGTFVNQQQISGRATLASGGSVTLGREITIVPVESEAQLTNALNQAPQRIERKAVAIKRYPVVVSGSEVARPARLVLSPKMTVNIGRDPGSEMWLGAPHISRRHLSIFVDESGKIALTDQSTNGTAYEGGILRRGDSVKISDRAQVFDLGSEVTVAVCFNEEEEKTFLSSQGAAHSFKRAISGKDGGAEEGASEANELQQSVSFFAPQLKLGFMNWLKNFYLSRGRYARAALVFYGLAVLMVVVLVGMILFKVFA